MDEDSHMPTKANEAFSRVLIDDALRDSQWDILDPKQVKFEVSGSTGRADYILSGPRGPLCVLEAKKEDTDPYDAKDQALGYAQNVGAPFIILSNGSDHYFWNHTRTDEDAHRIERFPSLVDLERLRYKNLQPPRPFSTEVVTPDYLAKVAPGYKLRGYQIRALDSSPKPTTKRGGVSS